MFVLIPMSCRIRFILQVLFVLIGSTACGIIIVAWIKFILGIGSGIGNFLVELIWGSNL